MTTRDKKLLEIYMQGFREELYSEPLRSFPKKLEQSAYDFGRLDAIVGDDVASSDLQTNEEILSKIKKIQEDEK